MKPMTRVRVFHNLNGGREDYEIYFQLECISDLKVIRGQSLVPISIPISIPIPIPRSLTMML